MIQPGATGFPPVAMRLTGNDRGLLTAFNSVTGAVVSLFSRILTFDGKLVEVQQDFTPAATRAAVTQSWEPGDGYLLSLMLQTTSTVRRGQLYCRVDLQRGLQAVPLVYATLINDYVHLGYRPTWPFGKQISPTEGPGVLRSVNIANPAAGADWSVTVPTGARWSIRGGTFTFVAGAAAGNRFARIVFDDGAVILHNTGLDQTLVATNARVMSLAPVEYVPVADANDAFVLAPLPMPLFAGWRMRSTTSGILAADQWSNIQMLVEEWIEP